jgi:hypothetical protein
VVSSSLIQKMCVCALCMLKWSTSLLALYCTVYLVTRLLISAAHESRALSTSTNFNYHSRIFHASRGGKSSIMPPSLVLASTTLWPIIDPFSMVLV